MSDALLGHSGFVGTTLLRQRAFQHLFRSHNIQDVAGRSFDLVVCAAAPAQKWIANRDPASDLKAIDGLIHHLEQIKCDRFVLISTVDVFANPVSVDESTTVDEEGLHPYGLHRRRLEKFVESRFTNHLIVRLPGLVGPGLKKNVIYDFQHNNNLQAIDSRGVFQFYPMVNLWYDIERSIEAELRLVHLTAEPISVTELATAAFGRRFDNHVVHTPAVYDFRSRHSEVFGGHGDYQYSRRETILAVRAYAQGTANASSCGTEAG